MGLSSSSTLSDRPIAWADQVVQPTGDFKIHHDGQLIRVQLRPNSSQHKKALLLCVLFLSCAVIAIAIIFALFGAWLVLPFAGLEILLLAVGAVSVCSQTGDIDLLVISRNYVHLTQRRRSSESVTSFIRQWTKIVLAPGKTRHDPIRLLVINRAQKIEIGEFLIESSKVRLYHQLTDQVSNHV